MSSNTVERPAATGLFAAEDSDTRTPVALTPAEPDSQPKPSVLRGLLA
jgi:hypothetical protein